MKIKKFRIKPRVSVVGRIVKNLMGLKKLSPEVEESIPLEIESLTPSIVPVAFYTTWTTGNIPPSFQEILAQSDFGRAVAVTAVVATIGSGPEEVISDLLMKGESHRSQLVTAISEEAVTLSFNFIAKLLVEEAKSDECDLIDPILVTESSLLSETLALMEAEQEGITMDSALHLTPRFTKVALVAWTPHGRRKKSAAIQKKKTN